MFVLLYILSTPAYMGTFQDAQSCQNAIREIYARRINIVGKRDPNTEQYINIQMNNKREFICVPTKV